MLTGFAILVLVMALTLADDADETAWNNYKRAYGKNYDTAEDEKRREIFLNRRNDIAAHNQGHNDGKATFQMGINKFADWTPEELNKVNDFSPSANRYVTASSTSSTAQNEDPPESKDWRGTGRVTPVKDQGDCHASWAFSVTGVLEGQLSNVSLSESYLIDCCNDAGCNEGCVRGSPESALWFLFTKKAITSETSYPYQDKKNEKCNLDQPEIALPILSVKHLAVGSEEELKRYVGLHGPVSVSIDATGDFPFYHDGVFFNTKCTDTTFTLSALVVGYGTEGGHPYWLVKTSFGPNWGEKGYIKMARNRGGHCGIANMAIFPIM